MASNDSHRKGPSPFSDSNSSRSIRSKVASRSLGGNDENLEPNESTALLSNMESGLNARGHSPTSKHSETIMDSSMRGMHDNLQPLVPLRADSMSRQQETQLDTVSAPHQRQHHTIPRPCAPPTSCTGETLLDFLSHIQTQ